MIERRAPSPDPEDLTLAQLNHLVKRFISRIEDTVTPAAYCLPRLDALPRNARTP